MSVFLVPHTSLEGMIEIDLGLPPPKFMLAVRFYGRELVRLGQIIDWQATDDTIAAWFNRHAEHLPHGMIGFKNIYLFGDAASRVPELVLGRLIIDEELAATYPDTGRDLAEAEAVADSRREWATQLETKRTEEIQANENH